MNKERFVEIMRGDSGKWEGDNAFQGMQIIAKYTDNIICGADHDIIYSEDIDELIKAGITEREVEELRRLNWIIHDNSWLACFV